MVISAVRMDRGEDGKRAVVGGLMLMSVGVFAAGRFRRSSTRFSLQSRLRVNEIFSFTNKGPKYTMVTYAVNHHGWKHLGINMALLWTLGNEMSLNDNVKLRDLIAVSVLSTAAAAAAEAPFLAPGTPLVGASGLVLGLLGALTVVDPHKSWLMILPVPGVPVTTLQLCQGTLVTHVGLLVLRGVLSPMQMALRGHLAGLAIGYMYAKMMIDSSPYDLVSISNECWKRSITSAELVLYWMYLSVRLWLPKPFATEADVGVLKAKHRFIRRVWKEEI